MWKVIYIAKGKSTAEAIRDALLAEGFMANLRQVGRGTNDEAAQFEVMTPHAEAVDAYQLLTQVLRHGL